MKQNYVVTVEGVLRKLSDGSPVQLAVELIRALGQGNNLVMLTTENAEETEGWLEIHGIRPGMTIGKDANAVLQMNRIQHEWGYPVSAVIEPDPAVCAKLVDQGYTVIGFFHPNFAKREWRPDFEASVRPWEELKSAMITQEQEQAADTRFSSD